MVFRSRTVFALFSFAICAATIAAQTTSFDTPTILPDGRGLPAGRGTVGEGRLVYESQCATCHGTNGRGASAPPLVGGRGTLRSAQPLETVGSFWPYATTLWDYLNRAMPPQRPGSLGADRVYALSAYVLWLNGIVSEQDVMTAETLPLVIMPNRDGFIADPRGPGRPP